MYLLFLEVDGVLVFVVVDYDVCFDGVVVHW